MPSGGKRLKGGGAASGPLRYAIYQRVSTDDQAKGDFSSTDAQREANARYVAEKCGVVFGVYTDDGFTGTNLKRPAWRRLLADAEDGKFDVVAVTFMSRLGRGDPYAVAEYQLKEVGVSVETTKEQYADDAGGYAARKVTNLLDGYQPKQSSDQTVAKLTEMFHRGYFPGGNRGFGYRLEPITDTPAWADRSPPKRRVPDEQDAPLVAAAYRTLLTARSVTAVRD